MRLRLAGAVASLALVAVACGDGGNDNPSVQGPPPTRADGGCAAKAGFTDAVQDKGMATAAGTVLSVTAGDSFFQPTCFTAVPTGSVEVTVTNQGQALHNFSIRDQGIDQDIEAGKTITATVRVSGTTPYFCKYHRTSGMVGALLT